MSGPLQGDVYVSTPLTNVAVAYFQTARNFIADRVFPNIPVQLQGGQYWIYDREDWNRDQMKKRADATESAGGGYKLTRAPYFADVWAFHKDIGDQTRANAGGMINMDRDATNFVSMKGVLRREIAFAEDYLRPGVWDFELDGVSATPTAGEFLQWSDPNSTPIEDVRTAKRRVLQRTGFLPNKLTLGVAVYDALLDHPDIIDRIKYGQTPGAPAMANEQILAQLFEVEEVLVSRAISNFATTGADENNDFIVGNHALLSYAPASPSILEPSAGYTFSWTGYLGAGAQGMRIKRFRMEQLAADRVEIEMAFDQRVVAKDLGFLFANAAFLPASA
jgi:hypothetical protein